MWMNAWSLCVSCCWWTSEEDDSHLKCIELHIAHQSMGTHINLTPVLCAQDGPTHTFCTPQKIYINSIYCDISSILQLGLRSEKK